MVSFVVTTSKLSFLQTSFYALLRHITTKNQPAPGQVSANYK